MRWKTVRNRQTSRWHSFDTDVKRIQPMLNVTLSANLGNLFNQLRSSSPSLSHILMIHSMRWPNRNPCTQNGQMGHQSPFGLDQMDHFSYGQYWVVHIGQWSKKCPIPIKIMFKQSSPWTPNDLYLYLSYMFYIYIIHSDFYNFNFT